MHSIRKYLPFVFGGMLLQSGLETTNMMKSMKAATDATNSIAEWMDVQPDTNFGPENKPLSDTSEESFSACLLLMDDNHRLVEWLAFHYHVLKLRTLIITTDPRSQTSPTPIFDKWRAHGMTILEWNESHLEKDPRSERSPTPTKLHRIRQQVFLVQCMRHLQGMNRTWTALWDTDEYIVWNQKPHSRVQLENMTDSVQIPSIERQDGLFTFLQNHVALSDQLTRPCITIPRMLFGAAASHHAQIQHRVPSWINATHHDTLRWRKHAKRDDHTANGFAKTIIDVSRVNLTGLKSALNPHRPLKKFCKFAQVEDRLSLFRINHYLGSWESYSARDDARKNTLRSTEAWQFKTDQAKDETDDNIRDWMNGFVRAQGQTKARDLLKGAGCLPGVGDESEARKKEWHSTLADEIMQSPKLPSRRKAARREFAKYLKSKSGNETGHNGGGNSNQGTMSTTSAKKRPSKQQRNRRHKRHENDKPNSL
jgi:hypothetical protein